MTKYLITFEKATANIEVVYNAGRFKRMKLISGNLERKQWQWLMMVIPQVEAELKDVQKEFKGKVNYGPLKETKSAYSIAIALYSEFYQKTNGFDPRINAVEGKALKEMLLYLQRLAGTEELAIGMLKVVFSSWHLLDMFYQNQMELRQINKNLPAILKTIKDHANPTKGRANSHGESIRENL